MAITDDLRKTLTDPTPLYFAAGTADLAVQQARKVPALIEKFQAEAPARIEAVRNADPKSVSDKVTAQAKEAQATMTAKVTEVFDAFDSDLKKFGESAQDLALRGVGVAAEYAVKAREAYEKVAERGEQTVKQWRGDASDEIVEFAVAVEPQQAARPAPKSASADRPAPKPASAARPTPKPASAARPTPRAETRTETRTDTRTESKTESKNGNGTKVAPKTVKAEAKPVPPRKPATAKKTTPPTGK